MTRIHETIVVELKAINSGLLGWNSYSFNQSHLHSSCSLLLNLWLMVMVYKTTFVI